MTGFDVANSNEYGPETYPVIVGSDGCCDDSMLHCPICKRGLGALHQIGAEVFVRSEEGSEDGAHASAVRWDADGRADRSMCGNPSERRDGIRIFFGCECGASAELAIVQHKGATLVIWESARARTKASSYVYFIEAVGLERIKIGVSEDPVKRMGQLAASAPTQLRLLGAMPGDAATEKRLHERFAHLRFEREWFHGTAELKEFIGRTGRDWV